MGRLSLLPFAILLIVAWAPAVAASGADEDLPFPLERRAGDPLLMVSPEVWLDVFLATADWSQAVQAAMSSRQISYNLYPLGDADGDGTEDFLAVNHTVEGTDADSISESQVRAISGDGFGVLWDLVVPDGAYWYVLGDIDGDDVEDLVVGTATTTGAGQGQGVGGASAYRSEYTTQHTFEVISGATGMAIASVPCESRIVQTRAGASAVVVSARFYDYNWTGCYLRPVAGGGVDVSQSTVLNYRGPTASLFVAGATVRLTTEEQRVTRYGPTGQKSWEWYMQRDNFYIYDAAPADYNGDGIGDLAYILSAAPPGYIYGPVGFVELPTVQAGELGMVDGKTGRVAWTLPLESGWYVEVEQVESLRAPGSHDLIVSEFRQVEGPAGPWQATLRQVDGASGAVLSTKALRDRIAAAIGHDDVDGDGRTELLLMQSKVTHDPVGGPMIEESVELGVVKTDYSPVWGPLKFDPSDAWYDWYVDVDLSGDGVDDLLFVRPSEANEEEVVFRFVSGADGAELWSYTVTSKVVSFEVIDDVDGTPGDDVAITLFDLPDEDLKGPAKPSASAAPVPASSGEETGINYADHVGRLELRRGTDRELVWEKRVHDPKDVQNVTAREVVASTAVIRDTNEDGSPELLFNFETPQYYLVFTETSVSLERQENGLSFALVIGGSDGKTLKSYPESRAQSPAVIGKAAKVQPPAAGADSGDRMIPAPGPAVALLAVAVLVWAARRQA